MRLLPAPPAIRIVVARDRTAEAQPTGGFIDVHRLDLVARYPDGTESRSFAYDVATRAALDAVVFVATYVEGGARQVYLRSSIRPPCTLRVVEPHHDGCLWELPAGLVEPGEDPVAATVRELEEELGFVVPASAVRPLGEWMFPVPAMIAERHVFHVVEVDPKARAVPTEDGSPLEHGAAVIALPVMEALEHCRRGAIRDAKTELALRRLLEVLP